MATSLWHLLGKYKVVIPIVQRDYAQGRQLGKAPLIRERFLSALQTAIQDSAPLELDFIYGYTKNGGGLEQFIPLDGQQRLTTLYLLHWFIAIKENRLKEAINHLGNFTYQTRHSSRVFCEELINFQPENLSGKIANTIIDQPWFFTAWKHDPTIDSMLTMLNAIQEKFRDSENVWSILTAENPSITFHLLPMEKLGIPDDLYIKMNSRGKELTNFENFKSRFSEILAQDQIDHFNSNVDQKWSDLFWDVFKNKKMVDLAQGVDQGFLRFVQYITDLIIYKNGLQVESSLDNFQTFKVIYSIRENADYLFKCLDAVAEIGSNGSEFFSSILFTGDREVVDGRVRLFFQNANINLFEKCAESYELTNRINSFSIGEQLMLYACLEHLMHKTQNFTERVRKIRNLIANSDDTIRKENMPSLLGTITEIVHDDHLNEDSRFSRRQMEEEEYKQRIITENSEMRFAIWELEDHSLLQGCIAIFIPFDHLLKEYAQQFRHIFVPTCDYYTISKALLSFGDYSQQYDGLRRLGTKTSSVWRELLTPSQRRGNFEETKKVLHELINYLMLNSQANLKSVIEDKLRMFKENSSCPKDWKYYYLKYESFIKWHGWDTEGFYHWWDYSNLPYQCTMMFKKQFNGRHWSPFLLSLQNVPGVTLEDYGQPLVFNIGTYAVRISNVNSGFRIAPVDEESQVLMDEIKRFGALDDEGIFQIQQDDAGFDLEDRVEKCSELLNNVYALSNISTAPSTVA